MARPQRRSASHECALFEPPSPLGWRVNKRISRQQGEQMVRDGLAYEEFDSLGAFVAFVLCDKPKAQPVKNGDVSSKPTPVMLTVRDMDLIAGTKFKFGRSRTTGMDETRRLTRQHPLTRKLLPPEDEIERAVEKLRLMTPRHVQQAAFA